MSNTRDRLEAFKTECWRRRNQVDNQDDKELYSGLIDLIAAEQVSIIQYEKLIIRVEKLERKGE